VVEFEIHWQFDYFNVIDGASNSMELIQFFADVVDVNNDKIANGFQIQNRI
jgi:capsule polysaccharide export protein KpsE/RkpR